MIRIREKPNNVWNPLQELRGKVNDCSDSPPAAIVLDLSGAAEKLDTGWFGGHR